MHDFSRFSCLCSGSKALLFTEARVKITDVILLAGVNACLWVSWCVDRCLWVSVGVYEGLWVSWVSMGIYGCSWVSMSACGFLGVSWVVGPGYVWYISVSCRIY